MKTLNNMGAELYIKGVMIGKKLEDKIKDNQGEFFIDKGMIIGVIVVLGLIIGALAKDEISAFFIKAFEELDSVFNI